MSKKLLIDALHTEETRVALIDEKKRLIEYDIDTSHKQTVKGNVYLAKVMRVEPSLQAAFVEYGGNRHGFLAFSEIHPDYFRIPISDREALSAKLESAVVEDDDDIVEKQVQDTTQQDDNSVSTIAGEAVDHSDEDQEEAKRRRPALHKMYKIQEVVHKNQIILIQVNKDERGQKGAALTSYLSLAGRYCVLMPNSPQAGGISRKISNIKERKKMREVLESLKLPKEMGMIIRTAGRGRTKTEIKRDANYLMRQWTEIRDLTLNSIAPALIYQEDSIIKRVIRDQYDKDTTEILVDGEECYKSAKAFMKKLLPSHAKNVKQYKNDKVPVFIQNQVEQQIEKMHEPTVMLPSGGSIVINPTEALVAIDINSGRATKERHIEETALNTNLEAAVEIARQVRMRDLAGLIVIDFIDMDDRRYTSQVERKVREAFKNDRARVQMGKISPFGLLELSRQRLRPSMLETSSSPCPHCHATGYIRSTESMALLVLRSLEEEGIANRSAKIKAIAPADVAFYILNEKRHHLAQIEIRHNMSVQIFGDPTFIAPNFKLIQIERRDGLQTAQEETVLTPDANTKKSNQQRRGRRPSSEKNRTQTPPSEDQKSAQKDQGQRQKNDRRHKKPQQDATSGPKSNPQNTGTDDTKYIGDKEQVPHQKRRRSNRRRHSQRQDRTDSKANDNKATPEATAQPQTDWRAVHAQKTADQGQESKQKGTPVTENNPAPKVTPKPEQKSGDPQKQSAPTPEKKTGPKRRSWLKKLLD